MPSIRIEDFDTWRPGYGLATVSVLVANTGTLASIFTDEALSIPAPNPVVLLDRIIGGIAYGKFATPLYVGGAYQLLINSVEQTGVERVPLTTPAGQDASFATAHATGGTQATNVPDHV